MPGGPRYFILLPIVGHIVVLQPYNALKIDPHRCFKGRDIQIKPLISHIRVCFFQSPLSMIAVVNGGGGNSFFWKVYKSDPFRDLSLGAQYAVTVMALPVPERWERFYHSEIFSTRCKIQKARNRQTGRFWGGVVGFGVWVLSLLFFIFSVCREERAGPVQQRWRKWFFIISRIFLDLLWWLQTGTPGMSRWRRKGPASPWPLTWRRHSWASAATSFSVLLMEWRNTLISLRRVEPLSFSNNEIKIYWNCRTFPLFCPLEFL